MTKSSPSLYLGLSGLDYAPTETLRIGPEAAFKIMDRIVIGAGVAHAASANDLNKILFSYSLLLKSECYELSAGWERNLRSGPSYLRSGAAHLVFAAPVRLGVAYWRGAPFAVSDSVKIYGVSGEWQVGSLKSAATYQYTESWRSVLASWLYAVTPAWRIGLSAASDQRGLIGSEGAFPSSRRASFAGEIFHAL